MVGRRYRLRTADGEDAEVSEDQYIIVMALRQAADDVVKGLTRNLSMVEQDYRGVPRRTFMFIDGEGLDAFAKQVRQQAQLIQREGSFWQGNAPPAARSFAEH